MTTPHVKHGKLTKPNYGHYGRHEWAIVGTPCGNIQALARRVIEALADDFQLGYMDADHGTPEADAQPMAEHTYTNKIAWQQWARQSAPGRADYWQFFHEADAVLVNGNHFEAAQQVVVIDEKKRDSLKKRLPQLTNVALWVYAGDATEPFDFVQEAFPDWAQRPSMRLDDPSPLVEHMRSTLHQAREGLGALVLAGGRSVRMSHDKTVIEYHGKPQREYLYELLGNYSPEVYLSCRPDQAKALDAQFETLPDTFLGLGPYGGILSALQKNPNQAWLVVAVDMPYISEDTLSHLMANRNPKALATAYRNPDNGLPEPLLSIWEPKAYPYLLTLMAHGIICPRKALLTSENVHLLDPPEAKVVRNVNTPEDLAQVRQEMGG